MVFISNWVELRMEMQIPMQIIMILIIIIMMISRQENNLSEHHGKAFLSGKCIKNYNFLRLRKVIKEMF